MTAKPSTQKKTTWLRIVPRQAENAYYRDLPMESWVLPTMRIGVMAKIMGNGSPEWRADFDGDRLKVIHLWVVPGKEWSANQVRVLFSAGGWEVEYIDGED